MHLLNEYDCAFNQTRGPNEIYVITGLDNDLSTSVLVLISNYIPYKVWGEITHPFLNFNGATVEV